MITNPSDPSDTVIVGAGRLGQKVAALLGSVVVAFADNDPAKQNRSALVPTLSLAEAVQRHPDALYIVAIWGANSSHRIRETEAELLSLGAWRTLPVGVALRDHGVSHYWLAPKAVFGDQEQAMRNGGLIWDDIASQVEYGTQVAARLSANPILLGEPVAGPAYWRPELVRFDASDVIVDGGAYDGDSLAAYQNLEQAGTVPGFAHWLAVEPDPATADRLDYRIAQCAPYKHKVTAIQAALGAAPGVTHLESTGTLTTTTSPTGTPVPVRTINDLAPEHTLSFIKLDIEGDEMAALDGAWDRIARDRPALAIAVYHKPCDLWQIPRAIKACCPDYRLSLRPHGNEGWDLVAYCVPPERVP